MQAHPEVRLIVVPDTRFQNECEGLRKHLGKKAVVSIWRVNRPSMKSTDNHPSEVELDGYDGFDAVLTADTLQELFDQVRDQLKKLGLMK